MAKISTPTPLLVTHMTDEFDCGELVLNDWLIKRALKNENSAVLSKLENFVKKLT